MFKRNGEYVAAGSPPFPGSEDPAHWTTYIASDDVDAGRMAVAQDPGGATFGIWQTGAHHGAELANELGSVIWNECQTTDPERAEEFYRGVFGYEVDMMQSVTVPCIAC